MALGEISPITHILYDVCILVMHLNYVVNWDHPLAIWAILTVL